MLKNNVIVKNKTGIHARPASLLVKTAGNYESNITIIYKDKKLKAKSIMGILAAGIPGGASVELICDGPDEEAAMTILSALFADGFGEE